MSHCLRSETCFHIVVIICNYYNGPISVGTMPSENAVFTPSSILFRPRQATCFVTSSGLVEAPGTAPGSEWLITKVIYRHS